MTLRRKKVKRYNSNFSFSRFLSLSIILILFISVFIIVIVLQQQQRIKQNAQTAGLPRLITVGNQIRTESGQPVVLRGGNILRHEWTTSMSFERLAFPEVAKDWKGNVMLRGFAANPVNSNDTVYLAALDEEQQLAQSNNMYIVFVYRSDAINGAMPTMPNDAAQQALVKLASRYKEKTNVIYGLGVEPHDVSWSTMLPRFNSMVTAIRTASAPYKPIIMIPGTNWGRYVNWAITAPVTADGGVNLVYKSHVYNPTADFQKLFIDTYNAGLAVFIGEFGTGSQMTQADVDNLLKITHDRNISWVAWIFDSEGCPCLLTDRTSMATTSYGTSVKNEMLTTPAIPVGTTTITPTSAPTPTSTSTVPTNTPTPTVQPELTPVSSDAISPTVLITYPSDKMQMKRRTKFTIQATASDNVRVTYVKFFVNNNLICPDSTANYTCGWTLPNSSGKSYNIRTEAYDAAGNKGIHSVTIYSTR